MHVGERPPARATLSVHGTGGGAFALALCDELGHDGHACVEIALPVLGYCSCRRRTAT